MNHRWKMITVPHSAFVGDYRCTKCLCYKRESVSKTRRGTWFFYDVDGSTLLPKSPRCKVRSLGSEERKPLSLHDDAAERKLLQNVYNRKAVSIPLSMIQVVYENSVRMGHALNMALVQDIAVRGLEEPITVRAQQTGLGLLPYVLVTGYERYDALKHIALMTGNDSPRIDARVLTDEESEAAIIIHENQSTPKPIHGKALPRALRELERHGKDCNCDMCCKGR